MMASSSSLPSSPITTSRTTTSTAEFQMEDFIENGNNGLAHGSVPIWTMAPPPPLPMPMRNTMTGIKKEEQQEELNPDDDNPRYKTEICRNFKERSKCIYGDQCQFAHGRRELRDVVKNTKYKTKPCQKYWVTGYCAYGPRCNFLHNENFSPVESMGMIKYQNYPHQSQGCGYGARGRML